MNDLSGIRLTNEDWLAIERELCRRSFADFIKRAWPHVIPDRLKWGWHMDAVAEHLEAVADGEITRLLVNIPPGTSKSTIIGVMYPAWLWGPKGQPHHRYIGAAHEQDLAIRDSRMMRDLVTSPWYQSLWPIGMKRDQDEKKYFENTSRGFRQACAVNAMTGRRGHTVAWDDPLSPKKSSSPAHRLDAIRTLTETVPTRLNDPETSAIIIVMQRLHEQDPSGYILSEGLAYEHLCIPMEYEPDRAKATSIGWTDPRTEDGELLMPERFPPHVIERDKKDMGSYAWHGQMQQRPSPRGGGIFKDEWWGYYGAVPKITHRIIFADTAQKAGEQHDYSVFECWGAIEGGGIALLDLMRGKWEAPELLTHARSFWAKHKAATGMGALRAFRIEDKSSGTGLIQTLKKEGVPVQGIPRAAGQDKVSRAMDAAPSVEAGLVKLPESAPWLSDFLAEASAFPNGANDDQIDPLCDAVADMLLGRGQAAVWMLPRGNR